MATIGAQVVDTSVKEASEKTWARKRERRIGQSNSKLEEAVLNCRERRINPMNGDS